MLKQLRQFVQEAPRRDTVHDAVVVGDYERPVEIAPTIHTEELPWLRGRDLELVMGRAVCDWIGWKR